MPTKILIAGAVVFAAVVPSLISAQELIHCPELSQSLSRGMTDSATSPMGQVKDYQHFLSDFYDIPQSEIMTGYFGPATELYTRKFQCEPGSPEICSGTASTNGYGVVGPQTRAKILRNCGDAHAARQYSVSPASGTAPLVVTATAQVSAHIATVDWGESNPTVGIDITNATHTYNTPGSYTVSFKDTAGTVRATKSVTVSAPGSTGTGYQVSPLWGLAPLKVTASLNGQDICASRHYIQWGSEGGGFFAGQGILGPVQACISNTYTFQTEGTYRVRIFNDANVMVKEETVTVVPAFGALVDPTKGTGGAAPTCTLTAFPSAIAYGRTATLQWTSSGALAGWVYYNDGIDDGVDTGFLWLPSVASGSQVVAPIATTTYVGVFYNTAGTSVCGARVGVTLGFGADSPLAPRILRADTYTANVFSAIEWFFNTFWIR